MGSFETDRKSTERRAGALFGNGTTDKKSSKLREELRLCRNDTEERSSKRRTDALFGNGTTDKKSSKLREELRLCRNDTEGHPTERRTRDRDDDRTTGD